jgi:hypothetical protein
MTADEHLAAAGVAIAVANWHALHAKHGNRDLAHTRDAAGIATRQLAAALTEGART